MCDNDATMRKTQMWQRVKEARRRAGMTQEQLGEAVGVTTSAVGQWEMRNPKKRSMPSRESLMAISRATGAPIEWLASDQADLDQPWGKNETHVTEILTPANSSVVESRDGVMEVNIARRVPVLRWSEVRAWVRYGNPQMLAQKEKLLCPIECSEKTFAIVVQGLQNEPLLRHGEFAYIDPLLPPTSGRLVLVDYGTGDVPRIRQLMAEDERSGVIRCANPSASEPPIPLSDGVKILGTVIFAGRFTI